MLDPFFIRQLKAPLARVAEKLDKYGFTANQVTVTGFLIGMTAVPLLWAQCYTLALVAIVINRSFDGLDGALARRQGISDAGGFLDISLDFLFYSAIPFGFVLADPSNNGIAGALLIFSFIGTGSSFLAFASIASKHNLNDPTYENKSLYYITGLTEGSETIFCFILFCIFPQYFPLIATIFALLCFFTTGTRIWHGYRMIQNIR